MIGLPNLTWTRLHHARGSFREKVPTPGTPLLAMYSPTPGSIYIDLDGEDLGQGGILVTNALSLVDFVKARGDTKSHAGLM
jgi:hypothetical protein